MALSSRSFEMLIPEILVLSVFMSSIKLDLNRTPELTSMCGRSLH
jgi:hypothetical protein